MCELNPAYLDDNLKKSFLSAYTSKEAYSSDDGALKLHMKPFPCCEMNNIIVGEDFIQELSSDLKSIDFYKKNNDLYKFQQSNDFKTLKIKSAKVIREFFLVKFRKWISEVTNIELLNMVDITSSKYHYSDILLCHDDELDSRRIAFVWYLVDPSWSDEDGGKLQLFNSDDNMEPSDVASSLLPAYNKLAWFEVSEYSHHQVSEVLSQTKCRLSVHGWFHCKPLPRAPRYIEPSPTLLDYCEVDHSLVVSWINPQYLDDVVQAEVRLKFEKTSEIQLPNFFIPEKYKLMCEAFFNPDLPWILMGPVNKRKFYSLILNDDDDGSCSTNDDDDASKTNNNKDLPTTECTTKQQQIQLIQQCIRLMKSEVMFLILSNMTGLRFHRFVPKSDENDDINNEDDEDEDEEEEEGDESASTDAAAESSSSATGSTSNNDITSTSSTVKHKHENEDETECPDPAAKKLKIDHRDGVEKNDLILKSIKEPVDHGPCNAKCCYTVRKWQSGCYATANHSTLDSEVLDVLLAFNCDDWNYEYGGFTTYITKDEDEELITIEPKGNSLNLVYREKDTLNFVKYIDNRSTRRSEDSECSSFHDISLTYFE